MTITVNNEISFYRYPPIGAEDWEYVYSVATVRVLELGMIPRGTFVDMANTASFAEAAELLAGTDYAVDAKTNSAQIEQMLLQRRTETRQLFVDLMPDKRIVNFLRAREDFANMRLAVRRVVTGRPLGLDYSNGRNIVPLVPNTTMGMECWGTWHATKGESGAEPPEPMKRMQELAEQWLLTGDEDESNGIRDEMREIHAQELYQIGTIGGLPWPIVVKKEMRNVPQDGICTFGKGGYLGWAEPCQWWKET